MESTRSVDIRCSFIVGTDVKGCKVVLVSDYESIDNETISLTRNNTFAYGQLNLTHKISCYHKAVAYTILIDDSTVIAFSVEETLTVNTNDRECSGNCLFYTRMHQNMISNGVLDRLYFHLNLPTQAMPIPKMQKLLF